MPDERKEFPNWSALRVVKMYNWRVDNIITCRSVTPKGSSLKLLNRGIQPNIDKYNDDDDVP